MRDRTRVGARAPRCLENRGNSLATRLRTLLGDHACTSALKNGSLRSDLVSFDFVDYSPTNKGFKPMVREQAFDVSESRVGGSGYFVLCVKRAHQ